VFEYADGHDARNSVGELKPTGLRPRFDDRLRERGIEVPSRVFEHAR
jgi:hypothetical protein